MSALPQSIEAPRSERVPYSDVDRDNPALGRPTIRTPEIIDQICNGLREGITLQQICRRKGMPSRATVWEWRHKDPELFQALARARAEGCDALADESLAIIDDGSNDYIDREVSQGRMQRVLDTEHVQRSKLRAEHRLKLVALWDPANYGAKVGVDLKATLSLESLVLASIPNAAQPLLNVTPAPSPQASDIDDLL